MTFLCSLRNSCLKIDEISYSFNVHVMMHIIINFPALFAVVVMLVVPIGAVAELFILLLFSNASCHILIFSLLLFAVVSLSHARS